jgi:hypothetical protein
LAVHQRIGLTGGAIKRQISSLPDHQRDGDMNSRDRRCEPWRYVNGMGVSGGFSWHGERGPLELPDESRDDAA